MPESPPLYDGQTRIVPGSGASRYTVKNVGGTYSCSCQGWLNQSRNPHYRTCKHLIAFRGARDEAQRIAPDGRVGMPGTVSRLLEGYWPSTGNAALPPSVERGGAAMRYEPSVAVRIPARARSASSPAPVHVESRVSKILKGKPAEPPAPPKKPHNAWTALMDDDHPLAEPVPPPSAEPPANDHAAVGAVRVDEPNWEKDACLIGGRLIDDATDHLKGDPVLVAAPPATPLRGPFGVLLAQSWDGVQNITGWLMSEKLDGIRAYWDGEQFRSRLDNVFATPEWYRERMPKGVHLDGELWMGRGRFQETTGYVRRMDRGEHWREIQYQVFDAPSVPGGFETRYAAIGTHIPIPIHCSKLPHTPCPNIEVLKQFLAHVEAHGGEGVMLRQPGSMYHRARSATLLKVKTFFDTEVAVFGTMPGKGRHLGAVGALRVRVPRDITLTAGKKTCFLKGGTEFEAGSGLSDVQRRHGAIPNGTLVTVRFQELSKDGIPRFPSVVAERNYE
jgi:hypothetical protein